MSSDDPTLDAADLIVRHLEGDEVDFPSLEDGLRAQAIADAATQSLRTGQPVQRPPLWAVGAGRCRSAEHLALPPIELTDVAAGQ